jgi:hypothetical protein
MTFKYRKSSVYLTVLVISLTIEVCLDFGGGHQRLGRLTVAHAQSAMATLNVTVVDPNGAAVPGTNIAATNISTGARREATTNKDGQVGIAQLAPGRYLITASKQDFETSQIENIVLNVGDLLGVRIQLKVGQIKAAVTVSASGSAYHESSSVSSLVDQQFIENLPLNGRSFNALFELTPGSVLAVANYSEPGQFSVNGQRQNANYFLVDGVSANVGISGGPQIEETSNGSVPAFTAFGGTNSMVTEDAMQEFRIQTSTYAPEFGRSPGAQVSIVTRSGSNKFHGTAFEYLRNEALDANDWFANSLGLPKAKLRQNDFGGVFGGPLRRNRTFFFFSYEGLRLLLPQVYNSTVPSLSARQSAIPATQSLLKAFPLPNGTDFGNGLAQFKTTYSSPSRLDGTSIRLDHIVNTKLSLFGRYNYAPSFTSLRGAFTGVSVSQISRASSAPTTLTVGAQMITSRVTNDLRVNYSRVRGAIEYLMDNFGGAVAPSTESIRPASATTQSSLFDVRFGQGFILLGSQANNYQRQINIIDNIATAVGSHQLGFGADYRRLMPISGVHQYDFSTFFNGINAEIAGQASQVTITGNFGRMFPVFTNFSAYAQDTWRVNQRLTLTYGVRWELNPPPHEAKGNDPFTVQGLDQPATATLTPRGTPLWQTTYGNFAPRIGAAYLLNAKPGRETILRGGFGMFYDMGNGPGSQAIYGANYPNSATKVLPNVQFPLTQSQLAPPAFSADPPYATLYIADPHLVLPRTYEWNVAIERSFGNAQTISATYVGAAGRRLLRQELINPNALFTDVFVTRNTATSDYDALEVQFQRRLSRGLQAMASYTWSHSIDIASTESSVNTPAASLDPKIDRGNSDFDVRHSVAAAVTYDLPSPGNDRFLRAIFGHWSMDSMLRARSATPIYIIQKPGLGPLFGVFGVTRPNLILNVPLYINDPTAPGGKRINPAAFANAPTGQQGSLGRNAVRAFPVSQMDFAVRRRFALREGLHLQLRAEFFNLFNHPNFAIVTPADRFGRPDFGRANSMLNQALGFDATGLNQRYQLGGPRSIQFAAKLQF